MAADVASVPARMQDGFNLEAFYMATRITLRLDFDTGSRLGPGKIALLEAIERTGSIAAAGREFGMSYRRAWLLTDEVNRIFDKPLIEARGGGRNGGGAVLTARGREIVALYRSVESAARKSTERDVRRIARILAR
jgi:molybdate transport system regulatory protein